MSVVHQPVLSATRGIYLCTLKLEVYLEGHQHMIVREAQTHVAGVTFFHNIIFFHSYVQCVCVQSLPTLRYHLYFAATIVCTQVSDQYENMFLLYIFGSFVFHIWTSDSSFVTVSAILKYISSFLSSY